MGEEERLNLERQIQSTQRDLQRDENEYLEDLNARRNDELGRLQREVLQTRAGVCERTEVRPRARGCDLRKRCGRHHASRDHGAAIHAGARGPTRRRSNRAVADALRHAAQVRRWPQPCASSRTNSPAASMEIRLEPLLASGR